MAMHVIRYKKRVRETFKAHRRVADPTRSSVFALCFLVNIGKIRHNLQVLRSPLCADMNI
jgi:hypothetical protein